MVSQLLFGERFSIVESSGTWLRIETLFDAYTGWIDSAQYGYVRWDEDTPGIIAGREMDCIREDGSRMKIIPGSELFEVKDDFSGFRVGGENYMMPGMDPVKLAPAATRGDSIAVPEHPVPVGRTNTDGYRLLRPCADRLQNTRDSFAPRCLTAGSERHHRRFYQ